MTRAPRMQPVRMCIGCRVRGDKQQFLRLVWTAEGVALDPTQTRPGRGAYLHHQVGCLSQAVRRRALGRALRVAGVVAGDLEQATAGLLEPILGSSR